MAIETGTPALRSMDDWDGVGPYVRASHVLVVGRIDTERAELAHRLRRVGAEVSVTSTAREAIQWIAESQPEAIVFDPLDFGTDAVAFLAAARAADPSVPVIVASRRASIGEAVAAMRAGAEHYLAPPLAPSELMSVLDDAIRRRRIRLGASSIDWPLLGDSRAAQKLRSDVARAANRGRTEPTLVTGEIFVGTRRIAEAIHAGSPVRDGPFVTVDCGCVTSAELFGTNGVNGRLGFVDASVDGTLFLDHVEDLDACAQKQLVERWSHRGPRGIRWLLRDRVIASSGCDLQVLAALELFRSDLAAWLSSFRVGVPSLRERRDDIPLIAEALLGTIATETRLVPGQFTPAARRLLQAYAWPGNALELENAVRVALTAAGKVPIEPGHLAANLRDWSAAPMMPRFPALTFAEAERRLILATFAAHGRNVIRTSAALGIAPRTIYYRLREYAGRPARPRLRTNSPSMI